jgi:hypothetical protein
VEECQLPSVSLAAVLVTLPVWVSLLVSVSVQQYRLRLP